MLKIICILSVFKSSEVCCFIYAFFYKDYWIFRLSNALGFKK